MFSQILNHRTDALEPYHHCLKQLSQKLQHLPNSDKEVFYIEVKRLIGLIKTRTNQSTFVEDVDMEYNVEETDFYFRHQDGTFHPQKERLD
jgi:hypothetical protein